MKKNMDKEFDRQLKEKLENFTPEVPTMLWDKIQEELDHRSETVVFGTPKIKRLNWSKYAAAAVIVVLFASLLVMTNQPKEVVYLTNSELETDPSSASSPFTQVQEEKPEDIKKSPSLTDDIRSIREVFANKLVDRDENLLSTPSNQEEALLHLALNESTQTGSTSNEQGLKNETVLDASKLQNLVASVDVQTDVQPSFPAVQVEDVHALGLPVKNHAVELESDEMDSDQPSRNRFGVSRLLNLMVAQIDRRDEKFISFSNDDEGSLKIDLNIAQAKQTRNK